MDAQLMGRRGDGVTNEAAVGLPPLSADRRGTWDYYRLEFLDDGYPGRRTGDLLAPHPIYGAYVVADYLAAFAKSKDSQYLDGARRVADAAVRRMESREDSLVFMYEPGTGISSMPHRFYSGLTQSRYLSVLSRLVQVGGEDRFHEAGHAVLRSLLIPTERGGVLRRTPCGAAQIEEYAHAVPDYTLNGWTTATLLVADYAAASRDPDAQELEADSVRGIREVLPLYDVPDLANSRYRLAGLATVTLDIQGTSARMADLAVSIPDHGTFPVDQPTRARTTGSRIRKGVGPDGAVKGGAVTADVYLSRITWPTPNRLSARITTTSSGTLTASIGDGEYNPLQARLMPTTFEQFGEVGLASGENRIELPIPWHLAELVSYPTSFGKLYEGRPHNAYHFIHIATLEKLARLTGDDAFGYYAARWAQYVKRWPQMAVYADAGIALERYGDGHVEGTTDGADRRKGPLRRPWRRLHRGPARGRA